MLQHSTGTFEDRINMHSTHSFYTKINLKTTVYWLVILELNGELTSSLISGHVVDEPTRFTSFFACDFLCWTSRVTIRIFFRTRRAVCSRVAREFSCRLSRDELATLARTLGYTRENTGLHSREHWATLARTLGYTRENTGLHSREHWATMTLLL